MKPKFKVTHIDGVPYVVMALFCRDSIDETDAWSSYHALVSHLEEKKSLHELHWEGIASFACELQHDDLYEAPFATALGGITPEYKGAVSCSVRSPMIGYRPILCPIDTDNMEIDFDVLGKLGLHLGDKVTFGTLYLDDTPQKNPKNPTPNGDIPDFINESEISIRDTSENPDEQMHWFYSHGVLIADRVILKNISWADLWDQTMIMGIYHDSFFDDEEDEEIRAELLENLHESLECLDTYELQVLLNLINDVFLDDEDEEDEEDEEGDC